MSKDVLAIARGELGNTESPAGSNRTKYGAWMKLDSQPWCMSFVQWCFAQAGYPLPFRTGSCNALLEWYKQNRPECVVTTPQPRDVIIYNFGHTGIVESVSSGKITAIEGNTSAGASGSQDNGGGVFRRTRSKSLVKAYIRPFEEDDMDQQKFNQMFRAAMDDYRKELRDNDSGQWSKEAREYAVASGLFAGSGTTPDGQPNYMWEDLLTREQVAQLFFRFAQRNGIGVMEFSKRLIDDVRALLWVVTVGGLLLAAYCIRVGYMGALPWLSAMVGLPWAAHGTVCAFYLNMAKSDHKVGGITFESAKAAGFSANAESENSPSI